MLLEQYHALAERACAQPAARRESRARLTTHALALLPTLGRRTIAATRCTLGRRAGDWSADYKLFSRSPWPSQPLFDPVFDEALARYPSGPLAVALDDTTLRRSGRKIPGARWLRDPLSPPFHVNLLWGERRLHAALLFPHYRERATPAVPCRAVPLRFEQVAHVRKPGTRASAADHAAYRQARRAHNLSTAAVALIGELRARLTERGGGERPLVIVGDGSFCNRTVFRAALPGVVWLSRTRKDARLSCVVPDTRRRYGVAFTPEEVRLGSFVPYRTVRIFHGGQWRTVQFKELPEVRWQRGAGQRRLRLLVVAPTPYKTSTHGRLHYHQAAYLLCSDPGELSAEHLVQFYFDRWQIEVNHRELKDICGIADAQVRATSSVPRHPSFAVACYSLLLIAAMQVFGPAWHAAFFSRPAWRKQQPVRPSALDLLTRLRHELHETRDSRHDLDQIARNLGRWAYT